MVARTGYDEEGWRIVWVECDLGEVLPPWLDRMVQRRLREALADWGGATTEEEREAVEATLESLGDMAGRVGWGGRKAAAELLEDWRMAAQAAGAWAAEALERGWAAGEKKLEEEARKNARQSELMDRPDLTEEEEEELNRLMYL